MADTDRANGSRGLAYVQRGAFLFAKYKSSKVSWAFNDIVQLWNADTQDGIESHRLELVPMLATANESDLATWKDKVKASIRFEGRHAHLMAFDEPDECSGNRSSCLTVNRAADLYQTYMNPDVVESADVSFGAPAVTSGQGDGKGLSWLREFLVQYTRCQIDFVPIHCSGDAGNVAAFKSYIGEAYAAAKGRPLWVIVSKVIGDAEGFLKTVADFLDTDLRVQRWAWLMVTGNTATELLLM